MAKYDTDEARDFRRARLPKVRPTAAPKMMSMREFRTEYASFHVVCRSEMPDVEENSQVMFCPACQVSYGPDMVKARKLHVGYEKDPLGNYAMLASLRCFGCDWQEIIPVEDKPIDSSTEARRLIEKMKNAPLFPYYQSGMLDTLNIGKPLMRFGEQLAEEVWGRRDEYDRQMHELQAMKIRDEYARAAAKQICEKIDNEVVQEVLKDSSSATKRSLLKRLTDYI